MKSENGNYTTSLLYNTYYCAADNPLCSYADYARSEVVFDIFATLPDEFPEVDRLLFRFYDECEEELSLSARASSLNVYGFPTLGMEYDVEYAVEAGALAIPTRRDPLRLKEEIVAEYDVRVFDNNQLAIRELEKIQLMLSLIPHEYFATEFNAITVRDNYLPPRGTISEGLWESFKENLRAQGYSFVNIFPHRPVEADQIPDQKDEKIEQFMSVLAHELNHAVDKHITISNPRLTAKIIRLITLAGTNPQDYIRSNVFLTTDENGETIGDDYFMRFNREFLASIANAWFQNSRDVLRMCINRYQHDSNVSVMSQCLFMLDVYARGHADENVSYGYSITSEGQVNRYTIPIYKYPNGHVYGFILDGASYVFAIDGDGMVLY